MEELINLIVNNGIGIVCVAYMIYFQMTTMKEQSSTMKEMLTNLTLMNDRLSQIEDALDKKWGVKMEEQTTFEDSTIEELGKECEVDNIVYS